MSEKLKVGRKVSARTIRGTEFHKGTIEEVKATAKGAFYKIKRNDGQASFSTRAACINA